MNAKAQRTKMRVAIESADQGVEDDVNMFYLEGNGVTYYGCEVIVDGTALTWYFAPTGEKEAYVFLYMHDNCFDDLVNNLDASNRNAVCNAWPLLMSALARGAGDNYGEPALIKLESTEKENSTFWCLALKAENFDLSKVEVENWTSDYVKEKIKRLVAYLAEMNEQLSKNEPSKWDMFVGGMKEGFKVWKWMRILGPVLGISPFFSGTVSPEGIVVE